MSRTFIHTKNYLFDLDIESRQIWRYGHGNVGSDHTDPCPVDGCGSRVWGPVEATSSEVDDFDEVWSGIQELLAYENNL